MQKHVTNQFAIAKCNITGLIYFIDGFERMFTVWHAVGVWSDTSEYVTNAQNADKWRCVFFPPEDYDLRKSIVFGKLFWCQFHMDCAAFLPVLRQAFQCYRTVDVRSKNDALPSFNDYGHFKNPSRSLINLNFRDCRHANVKKTAAVIAVKWMCNTCICQSMWIIGVCMCL